MTQLDDRAQGKVRSSYQSTIVLYVALDAPITINSIYLASQALNDSGLHGSTPVTITLAGAADEGDPRVSQYAAFKAVQVVDNHASEERDG